MRQANAGRRLAKMLLASVPAAQPTEDKSKQ